jgi:hypothetical protein
MQSFINWCADGADWTGTGGAAVSSAMDAAQHKSPAQISEQIKRLMHPY